MLLIASFSELDRSYQSYFKQFFVDQAHNRLWFHRLKGYSLKNGTDSFIIRIVELTTQSINKLISLYLEKTSISTVNCFLPLKCAQCPGRPSREAKVKVKIKWEIVVLSE